MSATQALDDLRRNTLTLLTNTIVQASGPGGVDTTSMSLGITDWGGARVRVAVRGTLVAAQGIPNNQIEDFDCHWTPMRLETLPALQRKSATTRKTSIGGLYDLWLTPQLSGCTVLIADWGNLVGMVHLRPYTRAQYSSLWMRNAWSVDSWRESFRSDNRSEMTAAVAATGGTPNRYILVETLGVAAHTTVVGVKRNNKWRFYAQQSDGTNVLRARRLAWTTWSAWSGWQAAVI